MLAGGTSYWISARRSGPVNGLAYYAIAVDESLSGAGVLRVWNGSQWEARLPDADLPYLVLGVEETSEQIRRMLGVSAGGQFLRGMRVSTASGMLGRLHREGKRNAREEIEELLQLGITSGRRLLARVNAQRQVELYGMPEESSAEVQIGEDGQIEHLDGRPLALSEQPAGRWARLGGLSTAGALMGHGGAVFIESAVWDGQRLRYGG
jgi:hypothetical protein